MKKPKVEVIKKITKASCMCCFKKGTKPDKNCTSCKGTGIYEGSHYIMTVGKIAYDMDTIK
jgi:hypothetical protein